VSTATAAAAVRPFRFRRWGDAAWMPADAIPVDPPRDETPLPDDAGDAAVAASDAMAAEMSCVERAIALWRVADLDLAPIVGRQGALAVLRRTLSLSRPAFGWLPAPEDIHDVDAAAACLSEAFACRQPVEADAAAFALSATFSELLSSLIGAASAARLVRAASRRDARLVHAGERLVPAALGIGAGAIADAAAKPRRQDAPKFLSASDVAPRAAAEQEHACLAGLRDANEHLVLAALAAQVSRSNAEDIHQRRAMFLAMVAHELRNPLNPIRMAAELLQHASANDGLLTQVQGILKRQVTHLARLVDDLLDGARAVVDAIRPSMTERRQTLVLRLAPVVMRVHADPVRLAQIFNNLLDNASKYTMQGGEISLELTGDGRSATLRVTDNGIGISADALPHIFDLFVQENRARAHDGQGLGIGLAIVRELVEAHGGTIFVTSAGRGFGSQFVVTLPTLPDAAIVTTPGAWLPAA
jgi:signal transduction histidine kinase